MSDSAVVIGTAVEVIVSLDGTYGKTWDQVATHLEVLAEEGEQTYANPATLAALVRALLAYGALPER